MYTYPINFRFAIFDIGDRITITDGNDQTLGQAQQKAFELVEDISIYGSESQDRLLYRIRTDQILDFDGTYSITDAEDKAIGSVVRDGMRSLWRASYEIKDRTDNAIGRTTERNPVVKLMDGMLGMVPYAEFALGYFLHPKYDIDMQDGRQACIVKRRSFLESRFTLESESNFSSEEEQLLLPAVVMMLILERERG